MQQLTAPQVRQALIVDADVIHLCLPLPESVALTHQWVRRFCAHCDASMLSEEWGADRYQAHIDCGPFRVLLCIEWLCEAIWLEPDAGETASLAAIVEHLQNNLSSQNGQ